MAAAAAADHSISSPVATDEMKMETAQRRQLENSNRRRRESIEDFAFDKMERIIVSEGEVSTLSNVPAAIQNEIDEIDIRSINRSLRGTAPRRFTQQEATPLFEPIPTNSADTNPTLPQISSNQSNSTGTATDTGKDGADIILTVLCLLILAPCIFASFAQVIYSIKKRKQDRRERELEEVGTNPNSRMLVLSEIFKNEARVSSSQYCAITMCNFFDHNTS